MREGKVGELKDEVKRVENRLDDLLRSLSSFEDKEGRGFDVSVPIPGADSSLSDIRARHAVIAGLVQKMERKGGDTIPLSFFNAAANALRSISNSADQVEGEIRNIASWGGLSSFNYDNFHALASNGNQRNFAAPLKTLFDNSESFLVAFHALFQAINPSRASFNFSAATDALSKVIARGTDARNELSSSLKGASEKLKEIEARSATLTALSAQAEESSAAILEHRGRASEVLGQIENNRSQAKKILDEAEALATSVHDYQSKFDEFDAASSKRDETFRRQQSELMSLVSEFTDQKEFIRTIIEQSDNMLSSATVAGLSSEFRNIRDNLTEEVQKAHRTFNWSIGLLFVSAIPLIAFIFAPLIAPIFSENEAIISSISSLNGDRSGWQYVGQVIARFIILLPAIWLVTFATARYNSLFKLREHYAYKYSMAVAVDGFKKQAPGHEEMIAALVFEQLAFNPADKLGKQPEAPESPPNPVAQMLVEYLRRRTASEEGAQQHS